MRRGVPHITLVPAFDGGEVISMAAQLSPTLDCTGSGYTIPRTDVWAIIDVDDSQRVVVCPRPGSVQCLPPNLIRP